jgi:hypothetical protein
MMTITFTTTGAAVARRVIAARTAYDAAGAFDSRGRLDELDDAVKVYCAYRCIDLPDLNAYAGALWHHIDLERADLAEFQEDHVGPLMEFWEIASAVQREMTRLLGGDRDA